MKIVVTGRDPRGLAQQVRSVVDEAGGRSEIVTLDREGRFEGDPASPEIVHFGLGVSGSRVAMRALVPLFGAASLRWMQGPGAGVDHPLWQSLLDRGVRITNASGIHAEPIAQYVFTYVLFWERNVARHLAQQAAHEWNEIHSDDLAAKTLGIVGYGGIGQAAARIGRAFGMRVLATRRTPVEDDTMDRFVPLDRLHDLLAESDYVVLCMPFSDETRGMIGAAELAAMRESAVLINVARGGVVDEPVLVDALRARDIRGATLDVVSEEPLPESSPLWGLDNCVLTPHDAGYSPLGDARLGALFVDNLGRFLRDEPLVNEVFSSGITPSG